jgi:hypothetical protein
MTDYSEEVMNLISKHKYNGFEWWKSIKLLSFEANLTDEEMKEELSGCRDLHFIEKQKRNGEIRYTLYFVYGRRSGRFYVITFRSKIRVITVHQMGSKTLNKYFRRRFKKNENI